MKAIVFALLQAMAPVAVQSIWPMRVLGDGSQPVDPPLGPSATPEQIRERMAFKPFPNDLGQKVYDTICAVCWADWVKHQQALINHYGLQLQDPKARKFLYESLEQFLFTSAPQA